MEKGSHCSEANIINARLESMFGRHVEAAAPIFRVVWSNDQLEKRFGTFTDMVSDTFMKEVSEIREVLKYPNHDDKWIVERIVPNIRHDIYEGDYIYEPLYMFPSGLPLKWEAIEIVAKIALRHIDMDSADFVPKTEEDAVARHHQHLEKEKQKCLNMLDNTPLQSALHDGGAVALNGEAFDGKVNSGEHSTH